MSERLIGRSADLKRLRDEGYEVEVRHGFLVVHSVPYVNAQKQVVLGTIVTDLTLNNDKTDKPADHQVWFAGDHPCNSDGTTITQIKHTTSTTTLCDGVIVQHRFSCKPQIGYPDYHAKITRYIEIIQNQAKAVDPKADARTFKPISSSDEDSVFLYTDSASSRAGIANVTRRTAMAKLAIIGLGGSGGYVLDFVAKTNVREIHLFDGDVFLQHNAFRAPSAVSLQELDVRPKKVDYFARLYGQMRRGIFTHPDYVTEENVENLAGFDFAFICVDKPAVRKLLSEYLTKARVPFVDTGMELELLEEEQCLIGTCRVTLSTSDKFDHFSKHVSLDNGAIADDLYATNIQVAELNALCAVMAVIKWKKFCGFYQDCYGEHQSAYVINTHQLTRDEITRNKPE
ncbi:MAG: ThiF family adenylyltransferase [Burkholderiales bacterium]|nr:ThiF family adenylyltransferase [Anaerolineae bacterium]MCZ2419557.1 ThiF family adenylyltransferase [Burkholderiales bacterium]